LIPIEEAIAALDYLTGTTCSEYAGLPTYYT
jgi:hypothetical protein